MNNEIMNCTLAKVDVNNTKEKHDTRVCARMFPEEVATRHTVHSEAVKPVDSLITVYPQFVKEIHKLK